MGSESSHAKLCDAAEKADLATLQRLLELPEIRNDINAVNGEGNTPLLLFVAAATGRQQEADADKAAECLRLLVSHGADVHAQNIEGMTALHICAISREYETALKIAQTLLDEFGVDASATKWKRHEYPGQANGHIHQEDGCECGAHVGAAYQLATGQALAIPRQREADVTPMFLVCRSENQALAELLVAHGAKVNVYDADAGTPLSVAVDAGSSKMVAFILSQPGGKELISFPDGRGFLPLHNALYSDSCLEISTILIAAGSPVDTTISSDLARDNKRGLTLLMLACDLGSDRNPLVLPLVESLLDAGADPNKKAALGQNALVLSVLSRDLPVIKLLAARGADIKAMNEGNDPAKPLHAAAIAGHPELCRWLVIEAGCAVGERDADGYSALIHAAGYSAGDSAETVGTLAELGAEVEGCALDGRRPLHFAAFKGQVRCAAELIRLGADVEAEDENGWTPLHFAGRYHHRDVAEVLLESGALVEKTVRGGPRPKRKDGGEFDVVGFTAADLAKIVRGGQETVRFLVEKGDTLSLVTRDLKDEELWEEKGDSCCVM